MELSGKRNKARDTVSCVYWERKKWKQSVHDNRKMVSETEKEKSVDKSVSDVDVMSHDHYEYQPKLNFVIYFF